VAIGNRFAFIPKALKSSFLAPSLVGNQHRNGQTKVRWQRIVTVFRHDDGGTSIKVECLPVGVPEWNGWVNVFNREEAGQGAPTETSPEPSFGGTGDHQARAQSRSGGPPPVPDGARGQR